jgi:hypothetical protein
LPYLPAGTASTFSMASRPPLRAAARSNPGWMSIFTVDSLGAMSTIRLPSRFVRVSGLIRFFCCP